MTTPVHSPTAGRRRLRYALRRARDSLGLTQEQVGEAMDWSLSKVIRIETGGVGISTSDLRQLLQLYRVTDPEEVSELVELARIGRQRPWWTKYKDTLSSAYLAYVGLEDESSALRCVNPVGMPGLLQTEDYARALSDASWSPVFQAGRPEASGAVLADSVQVRMIRQREVLRRPSPPEITAILDESVLWRQVGGTEVLRRQLLHLTVLGREANVAIYVLPFRTGVMTVMSPFVILEFPDPTDPEVAYVESDPEHSMVDGDDVLPYRGFFERLREYSMSREESMERIARIAGELD
jgi:transcriptional regulator with XRE-family HTH domain